MKCLPLNPQRLALPSCSHTETIAVFAHYVFPFVLNGTVIGPLYEQCTTCGDKLYSPQSRRLIIDKRGLS